MIVISRSHAVKNNGSYYSSPTNATSKNNPGIVFSPILGQFWKSRGRDIPRLVTTHPLGFGDDKK